MKTVYIIGGTMGVGKTSVCRSLKSMLENSVFLDGDWCWDSSPFQVTEETKKMVIDNICYLLNNFIRSSVYENVVFCWVMHRQDIINSILEKIDTRDCNVKIISLVCDEKSLRERLQRDIDKGVRLPDVVDRSVARISMYRELDTIKIDTSGKDTEAVAKEIVAV